MKDVVFSNRALMMAGAAGLTIATLALPAEEVRAERCLLDTNEDGDADGNVDTVGGAVSDAGNAELACGVGAEATGGESVAVGSFAIASAQDATAVGQSADATASDAVAIGADSQATGDQSTAVGYQAAASGLRSTAVGNSAQATVARSTAIGYQSVADTADQVALGGTGTNIKIGDINASTYRGEQGFAGGITARVAPRVYISGAVAGSTAKKSTGGRVGVAFGF